MFDNVTYPKYMQSIFKSLKVSNQAINNLYCKQPGQTYFFRLTNFLTKTCVALDTSKGAGVGEWSEKQRSNSLEYKLNYVILRVHILYLRLNHF